MSLTDMLHFSVLMQYLNVLNNHKHFIQEIHAPCELMLNICDLVYSVQSQQYNNLFRDIFPFLFLIQEPVRTVYYVINIHQCTRHVPYRRAKTEQNSTEVMAPNHVPPSIYAIPSPLSSYRDQKRSLYARRLYFMIYIRQNQSL